MCCPLCPNAICPGMLHYPGCLCPVRLPGLKGERWLLPRSQVALWRSRIIQRANLWVTFLYLLIPIGLYHYICILLYCHITILLCCYIIIGIFFYIYLLFSTPFFQALSPTGRWLYSLSVPIDMEFPYRKGVLSCFDSYLAFSIERRWCPFLFLAYGPRTWILPYPLFPLLSVLSLGREWWKTSFYFSRSLIVLYSCVFHPSIR